jgi:hypothetical protein
MSFAHQYRAGTGIAQVIAQCGFPNARRGIPFQVDP